MRKWKKLLVFLCALMMIGTPTILYAANTYASQGIVAKEFTNQRYDVVYSYGNGGNTLKLVVNFTEQHTTTGQIYSSSQSEYAFGSETYAELVRNADLGYEYTALNAYGYLNYGSVPQASIVNIKPSN